MPSDLRIKSGSFSLYLWFIDESIDELEDLAGDYIKSERYQIITSDSRRKEWLASKAIYRELDLEGDITYNSIGAPTIPSGNISISHSGRYVALAYSKDKILGVDIEQRKRSFVKVASRFLSSNEQLLVEQVSDRYSVDVNIVYCWCWSVKEAVYKLLGRMDVEFSRDIMITSLDESSALVKAFEITVIVDIITCKDMTIAMAIL